MAHQCSICYEKFDHDPSAQDRSLLPVQSRVCAHILCYSCMIAIYQATPPTYDSHKQVIVAVACPECRLPRAHDPYNPIISLSLCDLLAEREHMLQQHPDLALPESPTASRRPSTPRSRRLTMHEVDIAELLAAATKQRVESLWACVQSMLTVEKPQLRIFQEATRAMYFSSILLFGNMDRQALAS